jgi:hypothetical protein
MASRQSNVRRIKTQPKLTSEEIRRIAEKLAVRIEHDAEETALLLLFLTHLDALIQQRDSYLDIWSALYEFRQHLFLGTSAADHAQEEFQAKAYQDRGKLLMWPNERKESK